MADDKNKNEDPEEEKDDQFDDDEDFGLPDLEYDELDEDDEDGSSDDEFEEGATEDDISAEEDEIDLSGDNLDDIDISEEEMSDDDEPEDWEKELEKELEDELKAEEESPGFYEEESYEEFETKEEEIPASVFDNDEAPAPKAAPQYAAKPYEEVKPKSTSNVGRTVYQADSGSDKGKFTRTVVIGTLLFAAIAVVLLVLYNGDSTPKVAKKEKPVATKPVVKEEPKETPKEEVKPAEPKPKPKPKPAPSNTLPAGEITKLPQATGKTYVIVGSFFDDDLATDFANELAVKGRSPMVIPPFGASRFHRVAIAEFNSFKDAQQGIEEYKAEFGADIWPLRY